MTKRQAFTLVELLVVCAVLVFLAALVIPVAGRVKAKASGAVCLNNLRQWGLATQLYAAENRGLLPEEGVANPQEEKQQLGETALAWYIQLPQIAGLRPYREMPWRTNAAASPGRTIWLCPSNSRRCTASSKTNNLFHYCLNEEHDGTGPSDRKRTRLSSFSRPGTMVWLFDSKNLPAVGPAAYVHTNLHSGGAQFVFLDGHAARYRSGLYWDFENNRARHDHPQIAWNPQKVY
jgi:prepilin-type processing-associated H-X9-DG protein